MPHLDSAVLDAALAEWTTAASEHTTAVEMDEAYTAHVAAYEAALEAVHAAFRPRRDELWRQIALAGRGHDALRAIYRDVCGDVNVWRSLGSIGSLARLLNTTRDELLALPHIGHARLERLERVLAERGLALRD